MQENGCVQHCKLCETLRLLKDSNRARGSGLLVTPLGMEEAGKSPFRLLLETEGFDSQTSFELPSPRLVEKSQAPTPELFYVDLEERESRAELGPLYVQSPTSTLPPYESFSPSKPFLTPQAASGVTQLSLQAHLESVHIRLRKRSTPLSQLLYRTSKLDTHYPRKVRETFKPETHSTILTPLARQRRMTSAAKGKVAVPDKTVRASEPRKPMWSLHRESPSRVTRVLAAPPRNYERVKGEGGVVKVKVPELRTEPIKMTPKRSEQLKRRMK